MLIDVNGDDDVDGNGDDDDLYSYNADAHGPCLFVRLEKSSLCKKVCLSLCVTKNDHFANLAVCLSRKIITFCICLSVCHVFIITFHSTTEMRFEMCSVKYIMYINVANQQRVPSKTVPTFKQEYSV